MIEVKELNRLTRQAGSLDNTAPQVGDLRIWWIPQIPGTPFRVAVPDVQTASLLLRTLAAYDAFQLVNRIKPDYANTGGLEICEDLGEGPDWAEWSNDDGDDIQTVMREEHKKKSS